MLRLTSQRAVQIASRRAASTHTISKASIVELEKRWEELPASDQAELVSKLAKRQESNWNELTAEEKKAAWYISYGAWGPRRPIHPKGEAGKIASGVAIGLGISFAIFLGIRSFAPAPPKTLTREWQEQSDEYLKSKNANPFSGYSQVQSE